MKKSIVISGALSPITQEFGLSTVQQELVVGAGTFGAIFGGFFAGLVSIPSKNVLKVKNWHTRNRLLNKYFSFSSFLIDLEERFVLQLHL